MTCNLRNISVFLHVLIFMFFGGTLKVKESSLRKGSVTIARCFNIAGG